MKCDYCGTQQDKADYCKSCGAKLPEKKGNDVQRYDPFFYNGYIVYTLKNWSTDSVEVQFWLGYEMIERFAVTQDFLRSVVPEYCDPMPFFWELFLVACGEQECYEWKEKNTKYPATFVITRHENPEKVHWHTLSTHDMVQEFRK